MRSWTHTFFLLVLAAWTARALEVQLVSLRCQPTGSSGHS